MVRNMHHQLKKARFSASPDRQPPQWNDCVQTHQWHVKAELVQCGKVVKVL